MSIKKNGRPTVIDEAVLQKLELAFSLDCTDEEACLFADISPATLYNYQLKNKDFLERKRALTHTPVLKARQTVIARIGESYANAMDYLKRKKKLEFGENVDITSGGEKLPRPLLDISEIIKENTKPEQENKG